jgi:uncharacterized protein (TIGR03067 family)
MLAVLAIGWLIGADDAKQDAKKDQEGLQGTWKIARQESDGKTEPEDVLKKYEFVVKGTQYALKVDGQEVEAGTIQLDPTKKPKTIDFKIAKGNDSGKTQLGIYELDKDSFKMCLMQPGKEERPKEMSAKAGSPNLLFVLQRAK